MTADDLRAALADLGISGYRFAIECHVDPTTVYKWLKLKPGAYVPGYAVAIVRLLQQVRDLRSAA